MQDDGDIILILTDDCKACSNNEQVSGNRLLEDANNNVGGKHNQIVENRD